MSDTYTSLTTADIETLLLRAHTLPGSKTMEERIAEDFFELKKEKTRSRTKKKAKKQRNSRRSKNTQATKRNKKRR